MNPFIDTNDPLKIKIGNPALKPEMAWIYEIGYMKNFKSFNAGVNIFYRDINDVIQKVISTNADGIFVERPQNFSSAYLAGIELITAIRITNWWQLNGAYSQFDSKVTDSSFDGDALKDQVKWTAKILTDFSFPYEIHLQIAGSYLGPKPSSLQYEDKIFSVDAGLTKAIEGFGQITLRVADLFDTLKKVKNNRAGLSTSREVENTTGRIVTLTTTWSF
jgi:outer membrane receptor for ferrienterochelin and colicin